MKNYELVICYKNGESDRYYSRLTGKYWETDCNSKEEVLEEMKDIDPDTFTAIDECENVHSYGAEEVLYRIRSYGDAKDYPNEFLTFSTEEEAKDQIRLWEEVDKMNGWEETYWIEEVYE